MSSRWETRKRVLEAVTNEPQTANQIFYKTGIGDVRIILEELRDERKVKCKRCKMATHPYFTTQLWYRADSKHVKFPQYKNARLEAVYKAVTHEQQTQKQIADKSGVKFPQYSLGKLVQLGRIVHVRQQVQIPHYPSEVSFWHLPEV